MFVKVKGRFGDIRRIYSITTFYDTIRQCQVVRSGMRKCFAGCRISHTSSGGGRVSSQIEQMRPNFIQNDCLCRQKITGKDELGMIY